MGGMTIKEKILRCGKCFMLRRFILEPNYPKSTILSECDCGFLRMPVISFTKELEDPDLYIIRCFFCKKEPKNPLYCTGCRRIYCNTCKLSHNTKQKLKTPHIIINPYKFDFYCAEHQDVFNNAYCLGCGLNICQNCINEKKHKNHIVLLYDKLQMSKNDEKKIKKNIELSLGKILKKIEISKELIKRIKDKEKRKEFKDLVNASIKENRAILALVEYFYQIYIRVKNKNYAIIYNIMENIKFNFQPFILTKSESLEERLNNYIIYLQNDFVLFKRYVSTKNKNNILILGNNDKDNKDNNSKMKKEIHDNNKEEENIIKSEEKDNLVNKDINLDEKEKKEKIEENKENDNIKEEIDENNNNNESKRLRRGSIFVINEIINEKYDDDIFPEDSEEIDFDISTQVKNQEKQDNKLIPSNNINEEQSKEENERIILEKDDIPNSESDFDVTFNPAAVKAANNVNDSNNKNEIKDKDDNNIINNKQENEILIKEQEQEKEQEKNLKEEEKVVKIEDQIVNQDDNNNNQNNKIENEENNLNNINNEKEKIEEVISNENINEQNLIDKKNFNEENSIKEIKIEENKEEIKEEKKEEIQDDKKEKEVIKEVIKEELKVEIKDEKKEEIKEEFKEEIKEEFKEELKEEIKEELKEEIKEDKKEEIKEDKKEEIKDEKKEEHIENVKNEKEEELKEEIKEEIKKEENKNEIKESVMTENKKENEKEDKKEEIKPIKEETIKKEDKKETKIQTLSIEDKKEINQAPNKKEDKKPSNKFIPSQTSSIKSRMNIFEKKFNNNTQNKNINPPPIKRVQTTNILSNPKFSELSKKMTMKVGTGPMPKTETKKEPENIITQKEDPNKLIMNKPTISKKMNKKKPKKISFS